MRRARVSDFESNAVEEHEYGFVAALLTEFPEIASVRTSEPGPAITVTFLLASNPGQRAIDAFARRLNRALEALSRLIGDGVERKAKARLAAGAAPYEGAAIASLHVVLPLDSAVAEEFAVVRGMVLDSFGESVIVEPEEPGEGRRTPGREPASAEEDEAEPLEYSLRRFKASGAKGGIFGFREGARVLVYRS